MYFIIYNKNSITSKLVVWLSRREPAGQLLNDVEEVFAATGILPGNPLQLPGNSFFKMAV